jgi:hypothetical protein
LELSLFRSVEPLDLSPAEQGEEPGGRDEGIVAPKENPRSSERDVSEVTDVLMEPPECITENEIEFRLWRSTVASGNKVLGLPLFPTFSLPMYQNGGFPFLLFEGKMIPMTRVNVQRIIDELVRRTNDRNGEKRPVLPDASDLEVPSDFGRQVLPSSSTHF